MTDIVWLCILISFSWKNTYMHIHSCNDIELWNIKHWNGIQKKVICSNSFFEDKIPSENLRKLQNMITTLEFYSIFSILFLWWEYLWIHIHSHKHKKNWKHLKNFKWRRILLRTKSLKLDFLVNGRYLILQIFKNIKILNNINYINAMHLLEKYLVNII